MKYLSTIIGGAVVGALVFGIWPEMWKSYGIAGGWLAAVMLIGVAWFMNHWLGVIENPAGKIWVDQGWSIAAAGVAWAVVRFDAAPSQAVGTVACIGLGGVLGGLAAAAVKQTNPAFAAPVPATESDNGGKE
jgi:hypothetical protein